MLCCSCFTILVAPAIPSPARPPLESLPTPPLLLCSSTDWIKPGSQVFLPESFVLLIPVHFMSEK